MAEGFQVLSFLRRRTQYLKHPIRQLRMEAVIDPEPIPAIRHQSHLAQLRQMPGDVGLDLANGLGQLADTEFLVIEQEHEAA